MKQKQLLFSFLLAPMVLKNKLISNRDGSSLPSSFLPSNSELIPSDLTLSTLLKIDWGQPGFCTKWDADFNHATRACAKLMRAVRNREISKVIVYSFSRYARSTSHLLSALEEFKKLGVDFVSISENIETNSPLGVAIFSILGAVAQLERDILFERVKNGLANAKAKGVVLGRKKTRDSDLIRRLYLTGVTY